MNDLPTEDSKYKTYLGMNHDTYHKGIWVDYNGWRMKDLYALELIDGTIVDCAYPNGNGWSSFGKSDQAIIETFLSKLPNPDHRGLRDEHVAKVKLLTDEEAAYHDTLWGIGEYRDERNYRYFGYNFPEVINDNGKISFKVKRFFAIDIFGDKILK